MKNTLILVVKASPEQVPIGTNHIITSHFNVGILAPQKLGMPLGMIHIKKQDVVKPYVGASDAPLNTRASLQALESKTCYGSSIFDLDHNGGRQFNLIC